MARLAPWRMAAILSHFVSDVIVHVARPLTESLFY
jgi:hypothetical protein